ncbi:hypothetical protein L6164_025473 [Bauhinia variegata]|uniref:Uncharacterized protein n=1 Tax=Bauhinia variegata TaxID=167791 RepID=A0ACB9M3W4_BAUVA|nr:hypothetical protein L6164_025473 [Bauhinia variegata]
MLCLLCPKTLGYLARSATRPFSPSFSTSTADKTSFTVSYLIDKGFSQEAALEISKRARFGTSTKPDSVLTLLRNSGLTDSQLYDVIRKRPWLLSCDPNKNIQPKFEFLLSKGASRSDIVHMVTTSPRFLKRSLKNHIIPQYELVKKIVQTDKAAILCFKRYAKLLSFSHTCAAHNIDLLLENGVTESVIARLILLRTSLLEISSSELKKSIVEIKDLGIVPSKVQFLWALIAKLSMKESKWDAKVDAFKEWGWPEELVLEAFKRDPLIMLASLNRINAVMSFWVNELGWNSLVLAEGPRVFRYSFEKRIIPRASVVHFLLSKGLISEKANLFTPLDLTEELFLRKYVECFRKESSQILKLYKKKLSLTDKKENGSM